MPDGDLNQTIVLDTATTSKPSRKRRQVCTTALTPNTNPDAVLLQLGQRFEESWAAERAAWDAEPAYLADDVTSDEVAAVIGRATGVIVDAIASIPAKTLAGVMVKMRAVRWCRADSGPNLAMFENYTRSNITSFSFDVRLAASVLIDLDAMAEGAAQ